ncbi:MAG: endonuclease/exonuclease/phosphatase family protein [Desulfobacterales bacterium]
MIIAFAALLCFSCIGSAKAESTSESRSKTSLRVLTYNVFVGFKNDYKRHEHAVAWIVAQKPDVVALQELNRYTQKKLREDASSWDHPYVKLFKGKYGFNLGLTSRKPIRNVHMIARDGIWHGIIYGQTYGIGFFVLHLAPKPENIRLPETKIILSEIRKIQSVERPTVLLGDFNSASRLDKDYYQDKSRYKPEYSVMDQYLNAGWVDVVHQHQGPLTEKQASRPSLLVVDKRGFWRIDYILTSAELAQKCISARVMKDPATDFLSDHYPVMADFDWP